MTSSQAAVCGEAGPRRTCCAACLHAGVGFGGSHGHGGGDTKDSRKRQADAAQKQQQLDAAAAGLLRRLRQRLHSWAGWLGRAACTISWGVLECCIWRWRCHLACHAQRDRPLSFCFASLLPAPSPRPVPAAAAQERLQPLPLPLLGVARGGPLAPLLRLLLHNDSLMDVSSRHQLYSEVFSLAAALAGGLAGVL